MKDTWDNFSIKQMLEMGLNCVHDAAHSLYIIKHVYNGAVADIFLEMTFLGQTELFQ
jgi:hypothetical protein